MSRLVDVLNEERVGQRYVVGKLGEQKDEVTGEERIQMQL
jgi:hypothetical protein